MCLCRQVRHTKTAQMGSWSFLLVEQLTCFKVRKYTLLRKSFYKLYISVTTKISLLNTLQHNSKHENMPDQTNCSFTTAYDFEHDTHRSSLVPTADSWQCLLLSAPPVVPHCGTAWPKCGGAIRLRLRTHLNKPMLWYYSIPMYKRSWSYKIYQKIDNLQQKQKWYMWCVFGFRSFKRLIFIFILYYIYIILIFILLLIFIVIACLDWQVMHFNM